MYGWGPVSPHSVPLEAPRNTLTDPGADAGNPGTVRPSAPDAPKYPTQAADLRVQYRMWKTEANLRKAPSPGQGAGRPKR